ncbi:uncharacterized protein PAC_04518 [Phialocephala subalpina]|uniref:Uncharacterized protein n=1 Tax=Phialocephala subalpina TaxID=576137 RepID=A0A1L7WPD1_9HELO|nr:uncharacterized protein PAC_04518 [Phialocephala subalpina]
MTEPAPALVPDPSGRGTWSLLYSCVLTLTICVWSCIHLSVPAHGEPFWSIQGRKVLWLLAALFAAELVFLAAFQQSCLAKSFLKRLEELRELHVEKHVQMLENRMSQHKFDLAYAYYALMSSFAVDISHLHNSIERATLTANGLLFLAQEGHFIDLPPESIEDHSKANFFTKTLVCIQVLWVVGQAIERTIAGYPLCILEIHTLVHAFCALVMYSLWACKPYDIQRPTLVQSIDQKALAFFVMSSEWRLKRGFQS